MKIIQVVDNTSSQGTILKQFLDTEYECSLELFHVILFLSKFYDFVIDDGAVVVCDKE